MIGRQGIAPSGTCQSRFPHRDASGAIDSLAGLERGPASRAGSDRPLHSVRLRRTPPSTALRAEGFDGETESCWMGLTFLNRTLSSRAQSRDLSNQSSSFFEAISFGPSRALGAKGNGRTVYIGTHPAASGVSAKRRTACWPSLAARSRRGWMERPASWCREELTEDVVTRHAAARSRCHAVVGRPVGRLCETPSLSTAVSQRRPTARRPTQVLSVAGGLRSLRSHGMERPMTDGLFRQDHLQGREQQEAAEELLEQGPVDQSSELCAE